MAPPDLIDIGVNLTNKRFRADWRAVLARARAAGVRRMIVTGTSVAASHAAAELCEAAPGALWSTAGVHPHDAKSFRDEDLAALRALADRPQVVAIGECGLDFDRDFSPRDVQLRVFEAQLELAAELGLPVFLHERAATEAMVEVLTRFRPRLTGGVVHCFTGTKDALARYLALDLDIGLTGWICDERRGHDLLALVPEIPAERLLVETDAPYLTPRTRRPKPKGGRNEPAFLTDVVDAIAGVTGRSFAEVARQSTAAAERCFRLA